MKTLFQGLFILLISQNLFGQSSNVKISGSVSDLNKVRQSDIPVILLENTDALLVVKTNNKGEFEISTTFSIDNDYYILLDVKYNKNKTNLHVKGDSIIVDGYQLDLLVPQFIEERFDNGANYDLNEVKNYQNFDIDYFKQKLIEYPELCIEFRQYVHPEEKMKIIKRRMKNFKKELIDKGVNMKQIFFSNEIFKLNSSDQKSSIQAIVLSMEGNCNIKKR